MTMPNPSAEGRMSSQQDPFTEADVRIMWAARMQHTFETQFACVCGFRPSTNVDWEQHHVRAGLEALASAGRLLPPGTEHHEEWGVQLDSFPSGNPVIAYDRLDEPAARKMARRCGGVPVHRRAAGPWTPEVDRSTE